MDSQLDKLNYHNCLILTDNTLIKYGWPVSMDRQKDKKINIVAIDRQKYKGWLNRYVR